MVRDCKEGDHVHCDSEDLVRTIPDAFSHGDLTQTFLMNPEKSNLSSDAVSAYGEWFVVTFSNGLMVTCQAIRASRTTWKAW